MPLAEVWSFVRNQQSRHAPSEKLVDRLLEVIRKTWYLGFTAFGGPPVHFQIFHKKFVELNQDDDAAWIDEQTVSIIVLYIYQYGPAKLPLQQYQELFALCQALPGPASTKFLIVTVLIHSGWVPAIAAFLLWSLPGAVGMFALSLGVERISDTLPDPAYAFLSGLNASTVGIIAVAAVQLAEKCIKDPLSRLLVIFGACAGLCYSALWYYPVLIALGGSSAVIWDLWLGRQVRLLRQAWQAKKRRAADQAAVAEHEATTTSSMNARHISEPSQAQNGEAIELQPPIRATAPKTDTTTIQRRLAPLESEQVSSSNEHHTPSAASIAAPAAQSALLIHPSTPSNHGVSITTGLLALTIFLLSFIAITITNSQIPHTSSSRPLSLFANMYLAGTIIFGGGPVVIPLLREFVVTPGWVSPRDFLIGLAIIQAFPGPNFNFAVYLGALALPSAQSSSTTTASAAVLGSTLGYIGIFLPGLAFAVCAQGVWRKLRTKPEFTALLRGINATAVGLVFTAVYRLWEVGYLSNASVSGDGSDDIVGGRVSGRSLADEPWWVVVAVCTYAGNKWFGVPAAVGIAAGGVMGLGWWGVTQR